MDTTCHYCHLLNNPKPATQRLTFYHTTFRQNALRVVDVCDSHASYVRLSYHVKSNEDISPRQNDVSYADYRTAVARLYYGPDGWMALPTDYKRISLLAMLRACGGDNRFATQITAVLTIARYEGISLTD